MRRKVAFLFLGETLLIPHLFPIVERLAEIDPGLPIDLWVSASLQEDRLVAWTADYPEVRVRRAPGFKRASRNSTPDPRRSRRNCPCS